MTNIRVWPESQGKRVSTFALLLPVRILTTSLDALAPLTVRRILAVGGVRGQRS
jgi:hypothetical protein